ncbi:MAG: hypothetical protein J6M34_06310 [Clostridia bacterium]|nr:hypothetical protein [Clostridia bacterium]
MDSKNAVTDCEIVADICKIAKYWDGKKSIMTKKNPATVVVAGFLCFGGDYGSLFACGQNAGWL